jgi:hypothetical protein
MKKKIGPKDMANNTIVTMDMVCNPILQPHDSSHKVIVALPLLLTVNTTIIIALPLLLMANTTIIVALPLLLMAIQPPQENK